MTKQLCIAMLCGVLGYAVSASAQPGSWDRPEMGGPGAMLPTSPSGNLTEQTLFKRVDSVNWVDVTFEEVLDWLREQGENRINVVPRWNHLGVEGISRDSLVTLQLNNTFVADILNEALAQLSDTGELRYRGMRNKLTLSTRADFERTLHTKVYDCTDILFRVENFGQDAPLIDLQQAGQSGGGGGGGGGGQSVFQGAGGQTQQVSSEQYEQELEERLTALRELIEQVIAPETWDLTGSQTQNQGTGGGGRGRIRVIGRSLVITNTIEVHEMIAGRFDFEG